MHILLPPSEGKQAPVRGKPLDLTRLRRPELTGARTSVLDALVEVSAKPGATTLLKVSAGLSGVVAANTALRVAATAPAQRIYTGVLYDALGADTLDAAARRRMARRVMIFSALFGVLNPGDRIPTYRLSASVALPGIGPLGRFWRTRLQPTLASSGLVIDCRSAAYSAMWTPAPGRHLPVRVFREVNGERAVVSHLAKHSRGLVARALCEEVSEPKQPGDLVDLLNGYFAARELTTATGIAVEVRVELGDGSIDIITD